MGEDRGAELMTENAEAPGEVLLSVRDLRVEFRTGDHVVNAVNGVSFDVKNGETLAILGESGSGKSITFEAVLGILDSPPGIVTGGQAIFDGEDLFQQAPGKRRAVCGSRIGMIFQDPLSALNPVYTVGWQIAEMFRVHRGLSAAEAHKRSVALLELVGIPDAKRRAENYPHEFSGGMRQRLVIAMALAVDPFLVVADEPTTALDVTVEAQILALLKSLQRDKGVGLVIITHSMGVVAEIADRVCVMYAGRIVETADVSSIFETPAHPYTIGLLNSNPHRMAGRRLTPITGQPPDLADIPPGCPFHPRCTLAQDICRTVEPALSPGPSGGHKVACHFAHEVIAGAGRRGQA
jgi:oligopeptide transport system ATP-binding protein